MFWPVSFISTTGTSMGKYLPFSLLYCRSDSNRQLPAYKAGTLTFELRQHRMPLPGFEPGQMIPVLPLHHSGKRKPPVHDGTDGNRGVGASIYTGGLNSPGESVIPCMKTIHPLMQMRCVISGRYVIQHKENGFHRAGLLSHIFAIFYHGERGLSLAWQYKNPDTGSCLPVFRDPWYDS